MNRRFARRSTAALISGGVLLLTAATAAGAGETITLNLNGGTALSLTVCHELHHVQSFKLGTKLTMDGVVDPKPNLPDGTWKVKIKVQKCVSGTWRTIAQPHVLGNSTLVNGVKTAVFHFATKPRLKGLYRARSYYYGYTPYIQSADVLYKMHP